MNTTSFIGQKAVIYKYFENNSTSKSYSLYS